MPLFDFTLLADAIGSKVNPSIATPIELPNHVSRRTVQIIDGCYYRLQYSIKEPSLTAWVKLEYQNPDDLLWYELLPIVPNSGIGNDNVNGDFIMLSQLHFDQLWYPLTVFEVMIRCMCGTTKTGAGETYTVHYATLQTQQ